MAQNLSNLTTGAKVKFGKYSVNGETAQDIVWTVVAKNHQSSPAYPTNAITLHATEIIDLRCFDAAEPDNVDSDRQQGGNNYYSVSNIDQWLNKDAASNTWYTAAHSTDHSPDTSSGTGGYNTQYASRPGFLNAFSADEKAAILTTTIRVMTPSLEGLAPENIQRKVFLPSATEMGYTGYSEGTAWGYYTNDDSRIGYLTQQCLSETLSSSKPLDKTQSWVWLTRTANEAMPEMIWTVYDSGTIDTIPANDGSEGIRPALNLPSTLFVSNTTDSDGCYTMVWNTAPPAPTNLNVPTIYGGKSNTISWSSVTDPDGDSVSYKLECAYDGGDFSEIYSGTALSYDHIATYGKTSVQYRVRAVDNKGAYSTYTTSASVSIINNQAPVISGSDSNLGTKTTGFTQTYTVTDVNGDSVTVVEAIDGVQIRSYTVTLGKTNTFAVTDTTWLKQTNGNHTMTITASDPDGATSVRTYTFTKNVTTLSIQTAPMESTSMPTRVSVSVTKNIPAEAIFTVEVCNNGNDNEPTWEDATSSVTGALVYVFTNKSKTADSWAVMVRVKVNRNNGVGACYISAIGGAFE